MKKHFVTFLSPGTFVSETTTKPIESWDVEKAMEMARRIEERHGATPYGFMFETRSRGEKDLDSRTTKTSGIYYLGGVVETLAEVKARVKREGTEKENRILISNMEGNRWKRIITNTNSYRFTTQFGEQDTLVPFTPKPRKKDPRDV